MIVRCQKKHLSSALESMRNVVFAKKRSKLPRTPFYVRLVPLFDGALLLVSDVSTNETRMALRIPAKIFDHTHDEDATYGCDMEELLRVLRHAPADVALIFDKNGRVCLTFMEGILSLAPIDPAWLGKDWPCQEPESRAVETYALAAILRRVAPYTSEAKDTDALACVHLAKDTRDYVIAEGLDGHQYANAREKAPVLRALLPKNGLLIRREYADLLASILTYRSLGEKVSLSLTWEEKTVRVPVKKKGAGSACTHTATRPVKKRVVSGVTFSGERGSLFLPLPNFAFPTSRDFLKKARCSESVLTVEPRATLCILRMMEPLFGGDSRSVCLELAPDSVRFYCYGKAVGEMHLPATYSGTLSKIAFPIRHLRSIVADNAMSETLRFCLSAIEGPCLITGEKNRETVLMPMKIFEHEMNRGEV